MNEILIYLKDNTFDNNFIEELEQNLKSQSNYLEEDNLIKLYSDLPIILIENKIDNYKTEFSDIIADIIILENFDNVLNNKNDKSNNNLEDNRKNNFKNNLKNNSSLKINKLSYNKNMKGSGQCNNRASLLLTGNNTSNYKLDTSILSEDDFNIKQRGEYKLITPKASKHVWAINERPFRSVLLDSNNQIASIGFPKFGNLGEESFVDHKEILEKALTSNAPIWTSEKMDGSLAIRSVINGEVVFRTRGTEDGGDFKAILHHTAKKYPSLLDPKLFTDRSLLFEFVSNKPEYQIVVKYDKDDLVLLGHVNHQDLSLATRKELNNIADNYDLNLVNSYQLPTTIEGLSNEIWKWEDKEGVVIRCDNEQVLLKIKAEKYLALHRVKTNMTPTRIFEFCLDKKIQDFDTYKNEMYALGADWEVVSTTQSWVDNYFNSITSASKDLDNLKEEVEKAKVKYPERKNFAVEFASKLDPVLKSASFSLLNNQEDRAKAYMKEKYIDKALEVTKLEVKEKGIHLLEDIEEN